MTSDVQAAREQLEYEIASAERFIKAGCSRAIGLQADPELARTILSALTAAEERAATAERERDEARALAAERLEALRPFAGLAAQDGELGVNMNSPIGKWITIAQLNAGRRPHLGSRPWRMRRWRRWWRLGPSEFSFGAPRAGACRPTP